MGTAMGLTKIGTGLSGGQSNAGMGSNTMNQMASGMTAMHQKFMQMQALLMKKQEDQKQSAKQLKPGETCPVCGRDGTEQHEMMGKEDEAEDRGNDQIKEEDEKDEDGDDQEKPDDSS